MGVGGHYITWEEHKYPLEEAGQVPGPVQIGCTACSPAWMWNWKNWAQLGGNYQLLCSSAVTSSVCFQLYIMYSVQMPNKLRKYSLIWAAVSLYYN